MMNESNMYSEVYRILNILGEEYISKIPIDLYKYIESNRNKNYISKIDINTNIDNQNIMDETIEFISFINLKYWAEPDERKRLISIYDANERLHNEKIRERYNPDHIFKNNKLNLKEAEVNKESLPIEVKRDNIHKKIIRFFKKILDR